MRRAARRPLAGRTIVVTRARAQARAFSSLLRRQGARVIEAPAIVLRPPRAWAPVDRAIRRLATFDVVVFTSVNGVQRFFERLDRLQGRAGDLRRSAIVAIGPATRAALRRRGLRVAALPAEYRAEGVVRLLSRRGLLRRRLEGARILIPRAAVARDVLVQALRRRKARVVVVPVYRALPTSAGMPAVRAALRRGRLDLVTFASSSTVEHFVRRFKRTADRRLLRRVPAAVIGPITARTARRLGFRIAVQPRAYTIPALATAIARRLRRSAVVD
jgi:uroporphyrinogen III methyltransferase/synthase